MNRVFKVLLVSGSLRKNSTNTGLLRAVQQSKHPRFQFEWANILQFPVMNEDLQANECKELPECIKVVRNQIRNNDAILFAVPQYNFSIASPMKNAYDWMSREYPNDKCPVTQKIAGMVSSAGMIGGSNAQKHFNESVKFRKLNLLYETLDQSKRIQVNRFKGNKFDQQGNLTDQQIKKSLNIFLDQFGKWIQNKIEK